MGILDDFAQHLAQNLIQTLPQIAQQRLAALVAVKIGLPADADIYDRIRAARYVVTEQDEAPESRDDPYPYPTGDITVLGPQIFASTTVPAENTVINWRGENYVPQRDQSHDPEYPDDPGPLEPSDLPDLDRMEPAPMAGAHWQGRRGGQSG